MRITYMNSGNSVGDETNYESTIVIPIAAGLKQVLGFFEMHTVTSFKITVQRNSVTLLEKSIPVTTTMYIDLSVFAQLLPSVNSLYANTGINPSSSVKDTVRFTLVDAWVDRSYLFYLSSIMASHMNVRGWALRDERNLCSNANNSEVKTSVVTVYAGATKEAYTHDTRGLCTRVQSNTNFNVPTQVCKLAGNGSLAPEGSISQSIYIECLGNDVYVKFEKAFSGKTLTETVNVQSGFKGIVSATHEYDHFENATVSFSVWSKATSSVDVVLATYMINHGCKPSRWVRKSAGEGGGACVGSLTDYGNGKANRVIFDTTGMTAVSSYGRSDTMRFFFPCKSTAEVKRVYIDGVFNSFVLTGYRVSDRIFDRKLRFDNDENGNVYGWLEYENKVPRDIDINTTVLIRWLNSRGFYDTMYFERYSVKPIISSNNSGGNSVEYYEVTVQTELTTDNEPCFEWLQRSSEIKAQIPVDVHQVGKASLLAYNVLQSTGGSKSKIIQLKFKVLIQEP